MQFPAKKHFGYEMNPEEKCYVMRNAHSNKPEHNESNI